MVDVDSEFMDMCIVHDRCCDQCNTYGSAFNPNGRAQNCQLWYGITVNFLMRGHLFWCFNCIMLWTKVYFNIELYLRDTCHLGTPFWVSPLIYQRLYCVRLLSLVWWAIVHLKGFENWPIGLHLKGHWIWIFLLQQERLARAWSHAFLHTSTFDKVWSAQG